MSATQPASTTELKEYALRKLGKPVVEVNLADEQMNDIIDEAIQYFQEYHFDGTERAFHVEPVTATYFFWCYRNFYSWRNNHWWNIKCNCKDS